MSATFPTVLKNELSFLNAKELIEKPNLETEYRRRRRTHIELSESYISQNLDRVISYYKNGMKALIVMNTVGPNK